MNVTTFADITPDLKAAMPDLRGRLLANQSLAELTWFRVGGPAQVLFTPHLAPMTRGVLATCYARPTAATDTIEASIMIWPFGVDIRCLDAFAHRISR